MYLVKKEPAKAAELIELVVHDLFLEHTSILSDWRVIEVQ